jgi:hypothetical protein
MGQKIVCFGSLRPTRSRQDKSIEVGEVGSKRLSLGCNGVHVVSLYPLTWRSLEGGTLLGTAGAAAAGVCVCVCVCVCVHVCVITSLCKGIVPFRGGGSAAARQRASLARMHSKLHQPPTTPCLYLASPAWCTSHFVVV